jgi:hypothetical protein
LLEAGEYHYSIKIGGIETTTNVGNRDCSQAVEIDRVGDKQREIEAS